MSAFVTFAVSAQAALWNFFLQNWFTSSILLVSLILPKLFNLVKISIGKVVG